MTSTNSVNSTKVEHPAQKPGEDTPVVHIRVTETVNYLRALPLTDDLLDEAASLGKSRDADGVIEMLSEDSDHEVVVETVSDPHFFEGVPEREASRA